MTNAERVGESIVLEGVTRRYRPGSGLSILGLNAIDLRIDAGEAIAVTGPSGSGKSTLLQLVGGMDRLDGGRLMVGEVEVAGLSRSALTQHRRKVGFVFQRFHLLPALTAIDNVIAPVMPRRVDFNKRERAQQLLEAVGLGDRADAMPHELAGGQQQRVAIARALINRPGVLLADEPTGSLDTASGLEIMHLMLRLRKDFGTTLVVATHNNDIAQMCDREVHLIDGAIVT